MRDSVPFFRPDIGEAEVAEVGAVLRSGWLTTGKMCGRFEQEFAAAVGARHALAVNSCTAALHLAVHALALEPGQGVLVPAMTFAATAEVVRYEGGIPLLVDCDFETGNIDLAAAERLLSGEQPMRSTVRAVVGIMPVHVGGHMADVDALRAFADRHGLWMVEDAAHAFPAAWRADRASAWRRCGEATADVSCFSFYANKTITTGEGGMAVTDNPHLADRMRRMSLHGLSGGAWSRYGNQGSWDYRILDAGFKYNLTDIAAAIGVHQLARAEEMRREREEIALRYRDELEDVEEIDLPSFPAHRLHAWHLFTIRLNLERLTIDRNGFIEELKRRGVTPSVHWRPLHMHPYYEHQFGYQPEDCPQAARRFERIVSLPIFAGMRVSETAAVIRHIRRIAAQFGKRTALRTAHVASGVIP
jgi:perosamine synthetase